ncbi:MULTISPECIES: O-antigen ligase family protein [unclassified Butyrivibrio]|uniref:O-antigen ligase family protein n=1 Tax=unclassified Butyrivibrio TaxID=2639466 RepID=UPI00040FECAA|nr:MULTISPECIES: hypothetical protein [unclassified Butyrivibrio]
MIGDSSENNKCYLFIFLFYLLLFQNPLSHIIGLTKYIDEIIAIVAILLKMHELKAKKFVIRTNRDGFIGLLSIFVLMGVCGNIKYEYQPFFSVAIPDVFLCVKFWMAIYTSKYLFTNFNIEKCSQKLFIWCVKVPTFLFLILYILDNFIHIYPDNIRYGIRATHLFYSSPTGFVAACAFLISILMIIRPYIDKYYLYLVLLLLLMCSSLRSKAFVAATVFVLIQYFVYKKDKKIDYKTILLFLPLVVFITWDQIEFYYFSDIQDDSARFQLLVTSIEIAKNAFPLGSGFGTFGSYMSAINYSPIYYIYGLSNIHGLIEGETFFASDSFWPMILGQTGVIGLVCVIIIVVRMFKMIQRLREFDRSFYTCGLICLSYLLISSTAESAFVNPMAIPLAIMLGIIYGKLEKFERE